MSRRSQLILLAVIAAAGIFARALADQNLDLPVHPSTHVTEPLPTPPEDDPRDEPPPVFYGEEIDAEGDAIIYVIDLSGSMRMSNRLERAKAELARSIAGLAPTMRFDIVTYSCSIRRCFNALVPASAANKATALEFVASRGASGGTATGPATAVALSEKSCLSVVLLTDGSPNCGAQDANGHRRMIRGANSQNATINVFGIGASGTYREFCISVAGDSGGAYFDVP